MAIEHIPSSATTKLYQAYEQLIEHLQRISDWLPLNPKFIEIQKILIQPSAYIVTSEVSVRGEGRTSPLFRLFLRQT